MTVGVETFRWNVSLIERRPAGPSLRRGNFVVYELKKGVAAPAALEQINEYMKACEKKHNVSAKRIRGVILAQDAEPGLLKALGKEPNVKFKKYYFSIEMKDEMR